MVLRDPHLRVRTRAHNSNCGMSIRSRILALLSLLSLFCIGTFLLFDRSQAKENEISRQGRVNNVAAELQRLLSSAGRGP
jgi:hypothetical protein